MKDMLASMLKHTEIYRYQLHIFFPIKKEDKDNRKSHL